MCVREFVRAFVCACVCACLCVCVCVCQARAGDTLAADNTYLQPGLFAQQQQQLLYSQCLRESELHKTVRFECKAGVDVGTLSSDPDP